jgi:hypothetical protein
MAKQNLRERKMAGYDEWQFDEREWWFDEKIHEHLADNECIVCNKNGKVIGYRIAITTWPYEIEQKRYYCCEAHAWHDLFKLKEFEMRQTQTTIA